MTKRTILLAISSAFALAAVAMPSRSDLKKVQSAVNELMADDIAAMKGGKQTPEGAAAKAEELAGLATDEASKFLLRKGAFGLYVEGRKYDEALAALDRLSAEVKDVPDQVLADIIREKLKRIPRKNGGTLFAYYERLDQRMKSAAACARLEKQLKASPGDRDLRLQLAVARAQAGDWEKARDEFVAAGGKEATAAKSEKADPVAAADYWWGYSEESEVFRRHAADLYRKAVADGKVTGIKLALAQKRMGEYGEEPTSEKESAQPAETSPEKKSVAAAAVKPALKPMTLSLGKGVDLEFVGCPAGDCELKVGFVRPGEEKLKTKITRPFWFGKTPVTRGQWNASGCRKFFSVGGHFGPAYEESLKAVGDDLPMSYVTHCDAMMLCQELTRKFKGKLPKGYIVRMPTIAEWAYAMAAGSTDENDPYYQIVNWLPLSFEDGKSLKGGEMSVEDVVALRGAKAGAAYQKSLDVAAKTMGSRARCVRFWHPCGQGQPNRWGISELFGHDELLADTFGLGTGDGRPDRLMELLQQGRAKIGEKDNFFWSGCLGPVTVECRHYMQPEPTWRVNFLRMQRFAGRTDCAFARLVIGPDLVRERTGKDVFAEYEKAFPDVWNQTR